MADKPICLRCNREERDEGSKMCAECRVAAAAQVTRIQSQDTRKRAEAPKAKRCVGYRNRTFPYAKVRERYAAPRHEQFGYASATDKALRRAALYGVKRG